MAWRSAPSIMPARSGAQILKNGGNAIDAAVAIGYALAVVYPSAGNIGGGGLATIHLANGKDTFINFREKAPLAASANMYLDAKGNIIPMASLYGYQAVAVPGTVMGFQKMLDEYGTMKRDAGDGARDQAGRAGLCSERRRSGLFPGQ